MVMVVGREIGTWGLLALIMGAVVMIPSIISLALTLLAVVTALF